VLWRFITHRETQFAPSPVTDIRQLSLGGMAFGFVLDASRTAKFERSENLWRPGFIEGLYPQTVISV
jgi:hypothetical protein